MLPLHLVEDKVPWGSLYDDPAGGKTNTLLAVRNRAVGKYNRAIEGISKYMKYHIDGARVKIVGHVLAISSLGSFDIMQKLNEENYSTRKLSQLSIFGPKN
jgi:hypothetical protein